MKTKTNKSKENTQKYIENDKKNYTNLLLVVYVDECAISCSKTDLIGGDVKLNNESSRIEPFSHDNRLLHYWGNSSQQKDEELLINNYINQDVTSAYYVPDIESENLFNELIDPSTGKMFAYDNSKALEVKENKSAKDKKIYIISIQKVDNETCKESRQIQKNTFGYSSWRKKGKDSKHQRYKTSNFTTRELL